MLAVAVSWGLFALIVFTVFSAFHTPTPKPPLQPVEAIAAKKRRRSAKKKTQSRPAISAISYMLADDEVETDELDERLLALTPRSNTRGHMQRKRQRKSVLQPKKVESETQKLEPEEEVEIGWEQIKPKPITPKRKKAVVAEQQENSHPNQETHQQQSPRGIDDYGCDADCEFDWFSDQKAAGAAKHSRGKKSKSFKAAEKRGYATEKRAAQKLRTH